MVQYRIAVCGHILKLIPLVTNAIRRPLPYSTFLLQTQQDFIQLMSNAHKENVGDKEAVEDASEHATGCDNRLVKKGQKPENLIIVCINNNIMEQ